MANDLSDTLRDALGNVVQTRSRTWATHRPQGQRQERKRPGLSAMKGLAAGAGLAAAAPLAKKGVDAAAAAGPVATAGPADPERRRSAVSKVASKAGDKVGSNLKDAVSQQGR